MNKDQKRQELEAIQAELLAIKEELNTAEAAEDLLAELEALNMILSSFWAANDFDPAPELRKIIDASTLPQKIKDALYKLFDEVDHSEAMEAQLYAILNGSKQFLNKESLATYNIKLKHQAILDYLASMHLNNISYQDLDIAFEKRLRELLASKLTLEESPQQYSLNIKKWPIISGKTWDVDASLSMEFLADQNDVVQYQSDKGDNWPDFTAALFKNSVSLKLQDLVNRDFAARFTTTIFNASGPIPWGDFTDMLDGYFGEKFPGVKLSWAIKGGVISGGNPFREGNKLVVPKIAIGGTLLKVQAKLVIDSTKTFKALIGDPAFPIKKMGNFDFNISVSLKWTPEFLERLNQKRVKTKTPKVDPDKGKIDISKEEKKILKEMGEDSKKIISNVDEIADNIDLKNDITTRNSTRKALDKDNAKLSKEIHEKLKTMQKSAQKLKSKGAKKIANNVVNGAGKHILKKLGTRLAGKVILKFIPGLNVISTIVDLVEVGFVLYKYFSTPKEYLIEPKNYDTNPIDTMDDL
ncbi:hypothetical protein [Saprospira grandis]|uniref:Uncharacterized protein n=1 Tax=Saprospira grandis (strain Lewin) TaxID=984262 RepID=H6L304_SAPGL|nr:hypothetical protein [Saprospira grandis]AFC23731.1 hypothetical protein SGRA_0996 [Saprospira grandis str. Lewin]